MPRAPIKSARSPGIRVAIALALVLAVSGCAATPDLPQRQDGVFGVAPDLLPLNVLLTDQVAQPTTAINYAPPADRVAALRARQAILSQPTFDDDLRRRLALARAAGL
jgi:hypothetical protein